MWRLLFFCVLAVVPLHAGPVLAIPFFNLSSAQDLDWIGASISQTVRESLAARGILVLEHEERLEAYRRLSIKPNAHLTHASMIKVAQELDASEVIYGEYDFAPRKGTAAGPRGSLRITAHMLDMSQMRKDPDFMESGPLEDLAKLQSHLAWQVLRFLAPDTTPAADQFLKERPSIRLDAMENYIRGLLAASADEKHRYFTQAVRLDERFSQPCFEPRPLVLGEEGVPPCG